MLIKKIYIAGVRNLKPVQLNLHPEINVFIGTNGSGKTSFLEGIFFLALGRSFRTNKFNNIINFNHDFAVVAATYGSKTANKQIRINAVKYKNQEKISKVGGAVARNSQVAMLAPTQIINEETSKLIFKEPEVRRKFLDWLVFYSNEKYHHVWREFNKILQQRNMLLKNPSANFIATLANFDKVFVDLADKIKVARQAVWQKFEQVWLNVFNDFGLEFEIKPKISLFHGWNGDLSEKLLINREVDLKFKLTHHGPHKADLQFVINGKPAKDVLSRGQGKILSLAMMLARSRFIKTIAEREDFISVMLIDDLCSELDDVNVKRMMQELFDLKDDLQIFITGTDKNKLLQVLPVNKCNWFEVNDGWVKDNETST